MLADLFPENVKPVRMLVRGLPGGGKTTLLRYLGHHLATLAVGSAKEVISVYARLRDFRCSKMTVEEFICRQIDADSDSPEMCGVLCDPKRRLDRSTVLLLDGLDEIKDADTAGKIAELLDDFAKDHPRFKLVVTSRPIGLKREDYRSFRALDLQPLTRAMVDNYLTRWFAGKSEAITKLQQIFAEKPHIRALAANLFLLSMICYTFERGGKAELVERRSQLYESCTQLLLQRPYDQEDDSSSHIDYEQALELLKDLSLRFFLYQEADFAVDHVTLMGRRSPSATTLGTTEAFLDRLQRETGLLQRVKEGYTFIHRSLWEYFTALALRDNKNRDFVIRQAGNPDWEEIGRAGPWRFPRRWRSMRSWRKFRKGKSSPLAKYGKWLPGSLSRYSVPPDPRDFFVACCTGRR